MIGSCVRCAVLFANSWHEVGPSFSVAGLGFAMNWASGLVVVLRSRSPSFCGGGRQSVTPDITARAASD